LCPANLDPIAAVGEHVFHAPGGVHELALLIDDDAGEGFCERHRSAVGRELTRQELQQCRLAGTVGADKADAVAALYAKRKVADDRTLTERLADIFRLDDCLRADIVLGQGELSGAGSAEHRRTLRPHLVELRKPALVAPASRRYAALEPVKLDLEFGVELLGGARFLVVHPLGPRLEAAEADLGTPQVAAFEPEARPRKPRQKGTVVADGD